MAEKSSTVIRAFKRGTGKKNGGQQTGISDQIIAKIRELAWTGQHTQAIELASETLGRGDRPVASTMDLLDLRAESYIAVGKLDLASKDAKAMMKLAKGGDRKSKVEGRGVKTDGRNSSLQSTSS